MLTDAQKVKVRYHLGYPAIGTSFNPASGYRFFASYGQLEYRMSNLSADEVAMVTDMIASLDQLEAAIDASGVNADTAAAAVWTRNPDELAERHVLYQSKRIRLSRFLGVGLFGGAEDGTRRIVV